MAVTYNLQYRVKGTTPFTTGATGVTRDVNSEMLTTLTGLTFDPTTTYEFRWQRVVDGTITAHSNIVEATLQAVNTITDLSGGGSITGAGTFTYTTGSNSLTLVRNANKLVLHLTANWEYVSIEITGASGLPIQGNYYVRKTGTSPLTGYVLDGSVITKSSQKTVDVLLGRDYSYSVTIKFAGNSTGTILVTNY